MTCHTPDVSLLFRYFLVTCIFTDFPLIGTSFPLMEIPIILAKTFLSLSFNYIYCFVIQGPSSYSVKCGVGDPIITSVTLAWPLGIYILAN